MLNLNFQKFSLTCEKKLVFSLSFLILLNGCGGGGESSFTNYNPIVTAESINDKITTTKTSDTSDKSSNETVSNSNQSENSSTLKSSDSNNTSDKPSTKLSVTSMGTVSLPLHGSLNATYNFDFTSSKYGVISGSGQSYLYTPNKAESGEETLTYFVTEPNSQPYQAEIIITQNISSETPSPTNVNLDSTDNKTLTWDSESGTTYNAYYSAISGTGASGTKIVNVSSPFDLSFLKEGDYYVVITAEKDTKESKISDEIKVSIVSDITMTSNNSIQGTETPGETTTVSIGDGINIEMITIPAGCYLMGSPDGEGNENERPQHQVCLQQFQIGKYEVTWDQYQPCIDEGACPNNDNDGGDNGWGKGTRPVIEVSWNDIQNNYLPWLNKKTNVQFKLPSESQWEYACRGGAVNEAYCGGNNLDDVAWHRQNSGLKTHEVGLKAVNGFGLYDMTGNVWEWIEDCKHGNYENAPDDGNAWKDNCIDSNRIIRGASWSIYAETTLRAAKRSDYSQEKREYHIGFRLLKE